MFHVRVVELEDGGMGDAAAAAGMEAGFEARGEEAEEWVEAGWVVVSEAKRRAVRGRV